MSTLNNIKKKMGRPKVDSEPVTVRLVRQHLAALDRAALDAGKTRPDVVREALADWLKRKGYLAS